MAKIDNMKDLVYHLTATESKYRMDVSYWENLLRKTPRKSFYYISRLRRIHMLNAKRELIRDILKLIT